MPDIQFDIPAALVLLPLLFSGLVIVVTRLQHHDRLTTGRLATVLAAGTYTAALIALTLFPIRVALGGYANQVAWYHKINWIPILTIDPGSFWLNVIMTIPLGILAPLIFRLTSAREAARFGLAVSLTIEVLQFGGNAMFSSGRLADVNDLIANTLGAVLGWLLLATLSKINIFDRGISRLSFRPPLMANA